MANYDKNLTQKWFTQDPRPKPVLLLVAAMLILITKPYWSIISFDHDFEATAKRRTIRFVAFVILLVGIYISCNIDGWINWKHSFSRSPLAASCHYRATPWRLDTIVLALCGLVGLVALFIVGEHQSDVHGLWFSIK